MTQGKEIQKQLFLFPPATVSQVPYDQYAATILKPKTIGAQRRFLKRKSLALKKWIEANQQEGNPDNDRLEQAKARKLSITRRRVETRDLAMHGKAQDNVDSSLRHGEAHDNVDSSLGKSAPLSLLARHGEAHVCLWD